MTENNEWTARNWIKYTFFVIVTFYLAAMAFSAARDWTRSHIKTDMEYDPQWQADRKRTDEIIENAKKAAKKSQKSLDDTYRLLGVEPPERD